MASDESGAARRAPPTPSPAVDAAPQPPVDLSDEDLDDCYPGPCPSREAVERLCRNVAKLEASKLDIDDYFENSVYQPAVKNEGVPKANRRFLKQIRTYRKQLRDREKALDESDTGWVPRVSTSFAMGVYREHDDFDLDGVDMVIEPETSFNIKSVPTVNVIGIDSVVKGVRVKRSRQFRAACARYPTFKLKSKAFARQKQPLIATREPIKVDFRSDPRTDELLDDKSGCENIRSYCDPFERHVTFAALKGVPNIYLTYSQGWFPARGIAMNINDEFVVMLWEFSFELIECSCI